MGKIYSNQPFRIEIKYDSLPANVVSAIIKCKQPDNVMVDFAAVIDTANKTIYYVAAPGERLGKIGTFKFWPVLTDANGDTIPGEPFSTFINREGS